MIEKILERLEAERNDYLGFDDDDYFVGKSSAFEEAKTIVQEVAKEYGNKWIPCEREYPEEGIMVLVYDSKHDAMDVAEFLCPHWHTRWSKMDEDIIAWQPLPAPYQKGE